MISKKNKVLIVFIMLPFFLLSNSYGENNQDKSEYILALAPQNRPTLLLRAWKPVIDTFNRQTNSNIQLKFFPSKAVFEKYLLSGEADFVFASAFYYILAKQKHGYTPLVRSNAKVLKGIIVAPKDSDIEINDLDGRKVAFPSRNALAASLYIRSFLTSQGVNVDPDYAGTHENSYYYVFRGLAKAGGGINRTFNQFKYKDSLKVIYTTPGLPMHPLIAHPRVSDKVKEALISHFLTLNESDEGKDLLKEIKVAEPIQADHNRDYKVLNDLDIIRFSSFSKSSGISK